MPAKTRLAPTPSGFLHKGNAFSFLLTYLLAKQKGLRLFLRIDDLDFERKRAEYVQDVFDTLDFLEIACEEGPQSVDEFEQLYSQRHRLALYASALDRLKADGHLFACQCSRSQLKEYGERYPGFCKDKHYAFSEECAWRLHLKQGEEISFLNWESSPCKASLHEMGSFVLRKKGGMPAYQLASLVDDVFYGVDHVVRGADLLPSTAAQSMLASLLPEYSSFSDTRFFHHPLLKDTKGEKLSKSQGAESLLAYRKKHEGRAQLLSEFSQWIGINGLFYHTEHLVQAFIGQKYVPFRA